MIIVVVLWKSSRRLGPGRGWMALCGCKEGSVLPNYWQTISGIPPDSITWSGGLGRSGNTSCRGTRTQGTKGEGRGLFCHGNLCLNKISVTMIVTVKPSPSLRRALPGPRGKGPGTRQRLRKIRPNHKRIYAYYVTRTT
jgi:hypothetical protein